MSGLKIGIKRRRPINGPTLHVQSSPASLSQPHLHMCQQPCLSRISLSSRHPHSARRRQFLSLPRISLSQISLPPLHVSLSGRSLSLPRISRANLSTDGLLAAASTTDDLLQASHATSTAQMPAYPPRRGDGLRLARNRV